MNPNLVFAEKDDDLPTQDAIVITMPRNIKSEQELFLCISDVLGFIWHAEPNWDALVDFLRDLTWITEHNVVLTHEDCTGLSEADLGLYSSILSSAASFWKEKTYDREHHLIIAFPKNCEEQIMRAFIKYEIVFRGTNQPNQ